MRLIAEGHIRKMRIADAAPLDYALPLDEVAVPLNPLIGETLTLEWGGVIHCQHCGRVSKKSYQQGYCFPCMRRLAECDSCIVRPETCHIAQGTCRDADWAADHCLRDHIVYLAYSSGLKVGITRASQMPTRWFDQGAVQALPMLRVADRWLSGQMEVAFKQHISDRTDWRRMLKLVTPRDDLPAERARLLDLVAPRMQELRQQKGEAAIALWSDDTVAQWQYPVSHYPDKIRSLNLDKTPCISGTLLGMKGQYCLFDSGVINLRKYTSYQIRLYHGRPDA